TTIDVHGFLMSATRCVVVGAPVPSEAAIGSVSGSDPVVSVKVEPAGTVPTVVAIPVLGSTASTVPSFSFGMNAKQWYSPLKHAGSGLMCQQCTRHQSRASNSMVK